jgi:hypothetical protein
MAALAALATLLLGMGERNAVLPLLALGVAASSVYFVDVRRWIHLNTSMANLAGLAALVACLWDYRKVPQEENQLLALANLLIYLQCVLLYRQKTPRIYWMLALLSLLQVAVATVLNMSFWFGVLLVIYMLLAIATLIVFLLYREQQGYAGLLAQELPADDSGAWRPAGGRQGSPFIPRSMAGATHHDIRRGMFGEVSRMAAVTLLLTALVFVLVPRTSNSGAWGEQLVSSQHVVGFSESVTLGEMGEIVENPEEVLQMRFFDVDTGSNYYLSEVPLLRGTVLTEYKNGAWSPESLAIKKTITPVSFDLRNLVQQEFRVNRLNTSTLFAIQPILQDGVDRRLNYDSQSDRLYRGQARYTYPLEYTLYTNGLYGGRQLLITPCVYTPHAHDLSFNLLQPVDPEVHRGLRQMAAEVVENVPAKDVIARARMLERHLRDLGGFRYSLSPPKRNPNKDPIEDFVVDNRVGHCEYFASALTLMLRSLEIPARMCVGFKGADWNPLTGYYHVRQWHAHAWVEVYLEPGQLPRDTIEQRKAQIPVEQWKHGGWLRLDATPAFEGAELMPPASGFPSLRQLMDFTDHLWSGYVLSMDARRQRERVFNPLREGSKGIAAVLFDRELWRMTLNNMWKLMKGEKPDDTGLWFSWRAAVVTFVTLTLLLFLYRGAAWIVRRLMRLARSSPASTSGRKDAEVEFYRRLESILATRNLLRLPHQTQREFASSVGDELATDPRTIQVAAIPRRIAEMFYRVRFGKEQLQPPHLESVDRGLSELSAALAEDTP